MNVRVERCVGNKYRLSREGKQLMIRGDDYGDWTRAVATEAKNLAAYEWDIPRDKIRFVW